MIRDRWLRPLPFLLGLSLLVLPAISAPPAGASTHQVVIGVDHAGPAHHNFAYNDFFPRLGTAVHRGDVAVFSWATVADGFHDVAVLKSGESPSTAWSKVYPLAVPDTDDAGHQLQLNPTAVLGTQPPPGLPIPGSCGDAAKPCSYTGSADVVAGAQPTQGSPTFRVKIDAPVGSTVNFVCLIHPGMQGSVKVVPDSKPVTGPVTIANRAAAQYAAETAKALDAFTAANAAVYHDSPDGTRRIDALAGLAVGPVEILEMIPRTIRARAGDTVTWHYKPGSEIHTVTFPSHTHKAEPDPQFCDVNGVDVPAAEPPNQPCADMRGFEIHLVPGPQGPSTIAHTFTVASSGIIGANPSPQQYSFKFPNKATFTYFCHLHEHMLGTVKVTS